MKYSVINENKKDDLRRKYVSLLNMLKDVSTTQGEKENASNLMQKVKAEFDTLYPKENIIGLKQKLNPSSLSSILNKYVKAKNQSKRDIKKHGKPMDLRNMLSGQDNLGNPIRYSTSEIKKKINDLRKEQKLKKDSGQDYFNYDRWIEQLTARWLPLNQQEKITNIKRRQREEEDEPQRQMQKQEFNIKAAVESNRNLAHKIDAVLIGRPRHLFYGPEPWHGGRADFIYFFLKYFNVKDLRAAFSKLTAQERKDLKSLIDKIYVKGNTYDGLSQEQKNHIYNALDVL